MYVLFVRIAWMPMAAAVPIKVAIRAERKAMIKCCIKRIHDVFVLKKL